MKGYLIERNIKLNELPSTLKEINEPIPGEFDIIVNIE